jgi:hypothetical protein
VSSGSRIACSSSPPRQSWSRRLGRRPLSKRTVTTARRPSALTSYPTRSRGPSLSAGNARVSSSASSATSPSRRSVLVKSSAGLVSTEPSGAIFGRQPSTRRRAPVSTASRTVSRSAVHHARRPPSFDHEGSPRTTPSSPTSSGRSPRLSRLILLPWKPRAASSETAARSPRGGTHNPHRAAGPAGPTVRLAKLSTRVLQSAWLAKTSVPGSSPGCGSALPRSRMSPSARSAGAEGSWRIPSQAAATAMSATAPGTIQVRAARRESRGPLTGATASACA